MTIKNDKMHQFLNEKRKFLNYTNGDLLFGNFPDDMFDMQIIEFFQWFGVEDIGFDPEDPMSNYDPNINVDDKFKIFLEGLSSRFGSYDYINEVHKLFPEDFWIKVRRWVIMQPKRILLKTIPLTYN